jgi:methyl-accepting chemotaxis protein
MSPGQRWADWFERQQFRRKMAILAGLVAVAFVLVLCINIGFGFVNAYFLRRIERGFYPSIQLSRTLEETLASIQQGLEGAVAVGDTERFAVTDSLQDAFRQAVAQGQRDQVTDSARLASVEMGFLDYYALARSTTRRMIAQETGEKMTAALLAMTAKYRALRDTLEAHTRSDAAAITSAFRTSRTLILLGWLLSALVLLGSLVAVRWLGSVASRSLVEPLGEAVQVADLLAEGEIPATIRSAPLDEVGRLLRSMGAMTTYLREMSAAAEAIARGDLSVEVNPRSSRDTFGNAFARMTAYLKETAAVADAIAAGDLTLQVAPRSEADAFGRALVAMVGQLRDVIGALRGNAHALAAAAARLTAASQSLSQAAMDETAAVKQTTSSLQSVNVSVSDNAERSQRAEGMAVAGAASAEQTGRAMQATLSAFETISGKLEAIEQIAAQSTLLSLNAAIEAARAGDHGRGFSVVAGEVRNLADQSQLTAKDIAQVASASRNTVLESAKLLSGLVSTIRQTTTEVQGVAGTSVAQARALNEVNAALDQVSQIAQQNAQAAEELAAMAGDMARQAESLTQVLAYFSNVG